MILYKNDIYNLIPHRKPFLFVEQCEIIENGTYGIGSKIFNKDEYFFVGHFPNQPIVPGVILIEAMAQTAGIVVSKKYEEYKDKSVLFMSIANAKFRKPVYPNDKIFFEVKFVNQVKSFYKFSGIAFNNKKKVCEADFSAMITYA